MKSVYVLTMIVAASASAFAQTEGSHSIPPPPPPPPPPAVIEEVVDIDIAEPPAIINIDGSAASVNKTVTVTITEDGETYTIEVPNMDALKNLSDLEGLETLRYLDDPEADESLEFDDFTVRVQGDTIDSASVKIGNWKVVVKEKGDGTDDVDVEIDRWNKDDFEDLTDYRDVDVFETDWFLFDLGYNTFLNKDMEFSVPESYQALGNQQTWGSWDVNLHMFRSRVNMFKGYVNLNWGLSFEWHNYMMRGNSIPVAQMDTFTFAESAVDLKKNRFSTTHFTLPLMVGFETKPWDTENSFRIGFGYSPGLLVKGKTKIKAEDGVSKVKDNFNLTQPLRHEVNVMLGYGDFNVYASYDLNSIFTEGQGPELYPVSIGLIIRRGFDN